MWRPLVVLLLVGFLQLAVAAKRNKFHRSRRQAAFTCEKTETMVNPPFEYEDGVLCKDVVGRPADRYKDIYRTTCQRWLGLAKAPDSVANTYVDECHQYSNGSVRYTSRICCFGATSDQRCFTCDKINGTYDCTHGGKVVTCPDGQVCMTQNKDYTRNSYGRGFMFAQCASRDQCSSLENSNSKTCNSYIQTPSCTYCCSGPFCNYMVDNTYLFAADDACKSSPCENGGSCTLDTTKSDGYYCTCTKEYTGTYCSEYAGKLTCYNGGYGGDPTCYCPITTTGKECTLKAKLCESNKCLNGGTCYDHTALGFGLRCLCPSGWVGEKCEQEATIQCSDPNAYYAFDFRYYSYGDVYKKYSCTALKTYVETAKVSGYENFCLEPMKRDGVAAFREGVHGAVGRVEAISFKSCEVGDGLLLFQYHVCCPTCYSNPCMNGGWCQQNSEWDYVCKCRYGFEGRNCENRINMCIISGDPHYKTIDGKLIHFQGPCKYNLLSRSQASNGLPDFSIFGKNERRGDNKNVAYPSYFQINYMSYVIKLKRNGVVTVNDEVVYPDRAYKPHFVITKNGQFTRFESSDGLIVDFDGAWVGLIKAPDTYKGKVDGLCGNYDGNADNDMMTSSKTESGSYAEVGNSWKVDDPEDKECSGPTSDNPPECNSDTEKLVKASGYCGLLQDSASVFAKCLKASGDLGETFYESCTYDVCANQADLEAAKESACAILSSVAAHCESIGNPVSWRTAANCPLECPKGMTYKEKTSACAATCEKPDGPEKCSYPDTENCVCPDDLVLIEGTCQKPEMCKCAGGHEIGSSWLSQDCTVKYTCEPCKECPKRKVAKAYKSDHSCDGSEVCKMVDGVGQCLLNCYDAGWGDWGDWTPCDKSTGVKTRRRSCDNPPPPPGCPNSGCDGDDQETMTCSTDSTAEDVPPAPSCVPDFDFQKACSDCSLFKNPNMYVANPCSCGSYYQCTKNQLTGLFNVYELPCSPCTCWSQDKLTCDHDPEKRNPDHEKCAVVMPPGELVKTSGVYCTIGKRQFEAIPDKPKFYIDRDAGGVQMPCPPGTLFSIGDCQCVHGDNVVESKPVLCLDFNDKEHPLKTEQGVYVSWSKSTISVLEDGIEGKALRFEGDRLEIPFYNNKEMDKMAISLWYKRDSGHASVQTLVAKDDCTGVDDPSIMINTKLGGIGGGMRTTYNKLDAFKDIVSALNKWHHVVMSYDGTTLKFYLDGELKGSQSLSGFTARAHCPLLMGSLYKGNYFYGLMDQVCFYDEPLASSEVSQLFDEYNNPEP